MTKKRITLGLTEKVKVIGKKKDIFKETMARIDTGATNSAIDAKLAAELKLGPVIKTKMIKSSLGNGLRPVVRAQLIIGKKKITSEFTLADRSHMRYRILIGQNILVHNKFIIDPLK